MMSWKREGLPYTRARIPTLTLFIAVAALVALLPVTFAAEAPPVAEGDETVRHVEVRETILPRSAGEEEQRAPAEILRTLPRFGADLFAAAAQRAAAHDPDGEQEATQGTSTAPVPATYVLGPGDALSLQVFAGDWEQITQQMTVTPEGMIFPEQLGQVSAAGQTMEQLRGSLREAYARLFEQPTVTLTISAQRSIDVYVTGDAVRPGRYVLSGMATVLDALYAAGGPSEIGSYRHIRLSRVGAAGREIDLYDYLLTGNREGDVLLNPGDTIFVPPMGAEVGLAGEVRRPARYELREDATVADALEMAGGLTSQAHHVIHVWRTDEREGWRLLTCDVAEPGSGAPGEAVHDGDLIVARPIRDTVENTVRILGAVKRPGYYPVDRYPTVSALIEAAEGLSVNAHVGRGVISRLDDRRHFELITFEVAKALEGDPEHDLPLEAKDYVTIYEQEEIEPPFEVEVRGAVRAPGVYRWAANLRVSQLIARAGGLAPGAWAGRADLLRLTGEQTQEVIAVDLAAALSGDAEEDLVLQRGDRLEVKTREEVGRAGEVHIAGFVREEGTYPRREGMRVSDLIFAAGGLQPGAGPTVELTHGRFEGSPEPLELQLQLDGEEYAVEPDMLLEDDDSVTVTGRGQFQDRAEVVYLRGRVERPGAYPLRTGPGDEPYTVWDLLEAGDGLLDDANSAGIVVYRTRGAAVAEAQEQDLNRVLQSVNREARQQALQVDQAEQAQAMQQAVNQRLQQVMTTPSGVSIVLPPRPVQEEDWVAAIPIDGATLMQTRGEECNLALEPGDTVMIPRRVNIVTVLGAVPRSGAVPYTPDATVDHYVNESGGLREDAAANRMVVVHANGSVEPVRRNVIMNPGDVLVVPTRHIVRSVRTESDWQMWLQNIVSLATAALIF